MVGTGGRRAGVLVRAAVLLSVFAAGMGAGYALKTGESGETGEPPAREIRPGRVGFTNPLLDCEVGHYSPGRELPPFRRELAKLVSEIKERGEATEVAVYFRDLDNGPWFGVDERTSFTPGSLLKVPLMMACLLQAMHDPAFLEKEVLFQGFPDEGGLNAFVADAPLVRGRTYTVDQLIEQVAIYSDNHATFLLHSLVDPNILERLYRDLGFDPGLAKDPRKPAAISPRAYGSLFRVLYNASYLNREMSDKLLDYLSRAVYRKGLAAGVPPGTPISHKFGVNALPSSGGATVQLHDCGIVYSEHRPYFLCVMTRGSDEQLLAGVIARTSRLVWEKANR